ncbi:MAG TPA: hypothetical protein VGD87_04950 [Archangium sp.]
MCRPYIYAGAAGYLERFFRAPPLFLELLTLELEPRVVAVERFLESGDDDVREPRLELAGQARCGGAGACHQPGFRRRIGGLARQAPGRLAKSHHGVECLEQRADIHRAKPVQNVFRAAELSHASRNRR